MEGERLLYVKERKMSVSVCHSMTDGKVHRSGIVIYNCELHSKKRAKYAARNTYSELSPSLQAIPVASTFGASISSRCHFFPCL
jgi:hypothetical protein